MSQKFLVVSGEKVIGIIKSDLIPDISVYSDQFDVEQYSKAQRYGDAFKISMFVINELYQNKSRIILQVYSSWC